MDLEPKNTVNSWILCHAGVDFYQLDKWKNALIYMYLMAQEKDVLLPPWELHLEQ
jgi:hypothetical protein